MPATDRAASLGLHNIVHWRVRMLLLALIMFSLFYSTGCATYRKALGSAQYAIIYYANVTPSMSAGDANRNLFLSILAESGSDSALEIREALLLDLADAKPSVDRDIKALMTVSKKVGVPLIVFSNERALNSLFAVFNPNEGTFEYHSLRYAALDHNILLHDYPLARADYLAEALSAVSSEGGMQSLSALLIVRTHGSPGMALMPRINRDFRRIDRSLVLSQLDAVAHNDLALPDITLQGTDQNQFWNTLAGVASARNIRFPLVFLSSCESGVQTLEQALNIPNSVEKIAHSGNIGMSSELIDYAAIFRDLPDNASFDLAVEMLTQGLLKQRVQTIYVDDKWSALRWPLAKFAGSVWFLLAGLLPLIAWAVWYIAGIGKVTVSAAKVAES